MKVSCRVWIVRLYLLCFGIDTVFQETSLVPKNPKVLEGSSLTLSCRHEGEQTSLSSTWRSTYKDLFVLLQFDGYTDQCKVRTTISLPNNVHPKCSQDIFNISLSPVLNDMHGSKWTCIQLFDNGSVSSIYVEVPVKNVTMSLEGGKQPTPLRCLENESLSLECKSSFGRPPPSITWLIGGSYGDASVVSTSENTPVSFNASDETYNYTLTVLRLNVNRTLNNKRIFCNSTNLPDVASVSSNYFTFDVQYPPIVFPIVDIGIIEINNFTKSCKKLDGNPANTNLTWIRDNKLVSNGEYLNISPVLRNNEGYYTCSARNVMQYFNGSTVEGVGNTSFYLSVMYPPEDINVVLTNDTVRYYKVVNTFNVILGSIVTLICNASSRPPPSSYTWSGVMSASKNSITIHVTKNLSGSFTCTARNTMTMIPENINITGTSNKTYHMEVQYPPEIGTIQNITVIEYRKVNYTCPVTRGNPAETSYIWTRSVDDKEWKRDELLIDPVSRYDEGFYTLSATNIMKPIYGSEEQGVSNKTIYITVLYPPEEFRVMYSVDSLIRGNITDTFNIMNATNVTLSCSANSNPPLVNYSWSGPVTTINKTNLTLYVSESHSGNYKCSANNQMTESPGNTTTTGSNYTTFHMEVLYPPVIEDMQNIAIIEWKNTSIFCPVTSGNPNETNVRWTRELNITVWQTEILTIKSVSRNDEGIYTCIANNTMRPSYGKEKIGFSNKSLYLNVLYPPEAFSVTYSTDNRSYYNIPDAIKIIHGTYVILSCSARSNPPPVSYFWTGVMMDNNANISFNGTKNNAGECICSASNVMKEVPGDSIIGINNKTYHIDVLYPPKVKQMQNMTAIEGTPFSLNCSIGYGNPNDTTLKWVRMKDNMTWYSQTLSIENITRSDDSIYTCIANNTLSPTYGGQQIGLSSQTAHIEILCAPRESNGSTADNVTNVTSVQHVSTTLTFKALAYPKPSIQWYHKHNSSWIKFEIGSNGKLEIVSSPIVSEYSLTLLNISKEDYGQYRLDVYNIFGNHSQLFNLIPKDKPNPPIQYGYDDRYVTQTSVILWWEPEFDGGLPQTFFIQYRDDKSSWSKSRSLIDMNEDTMNITVNGLKSGTEYYFIIFASNDLGSSNTNAISIRTKDTVMDPSPSTAGQVAGGVVGGALGILVIIAVVFVFYKRKWIKIPTSDAKELMKRPSSDATTHVYQNVNLIQGSKTGKRLPPPPPPSEIALDEINAQQNEDINDMDDQIYLNTQGLIDDLRNVTIPELLSYVKDKTVDDMQEEFDKFPKGMVETIPYKVARSPENVSLNRYQGIYPYDHSRVVISGKPDFFINANYINGFRKGKAYVASLGPTVKHTHGFITFWEMVWNEDTDVIVMLTNLQEPSGMKCENYWADKGTTRLIGDFTIQSVSEDVAAEYTVRTFTVFKNDESRLITQLHYTAWPDKKVPEDVTSLIEFRQRVKAAPTRSHGALVVHCRYYSVRESVEPEHTLHLTSL